MGIFNSKSVRRRMSIFGISENVENALQKELDDQKMHYKPESLDLLTEQTHFTEKELQYLYQCFKQNCPSGFVSREQFAQIFRSFFNICLDADATEYAFLVFNTFDCDENGHITFSEFVRKLSMFTKGTLEDRLDWLFDLYDYNQRGYLTEEDFFRVCRAMYSMVGFHYYKDRLFPLALRRHVKHRFSNFDKTKKGRITRKDFMNGCLDDEEILSQLDTLKSVW